MIRAPQAEPVRAHFEVVRSDAGFTVRLIANGRNILSSTRQGYTHRADAYRACDIADPAQQFERRFVDERGA